MNAIFQSILLFFCATIAECCTYLPNNELAIVSIVNETARLNLQSLFIKQELTNVQLKSSDSNLNLQQYIYTHSVINRTFDQIISIKVLRSQYDGYPLNQYLLLNKINEQFQLYTNKYVFGQQNRLPEFIKKIDIDNLSCYDADFLNKKTIIIDCFNDTANYFIIQNDDDFQIFEDPSPFIDTSIKRQLFAFQNNIIMRVIYFDQDLNTSFIQFFEKQAQNNFLKLILVIDDQFLNQLIEEEEQEIHLEIIHIHYERQQMHILNNNQLIIQLNVTSLFNIHILKYYTPEYLSNIVQTAYHFETGITAYLSLNSLFLINKNETHFHLVDNNNKLSTIIFTKNVFLLIHNDTITMYNFQMKKITTYQVKENSKFIIDQTLDEILQFSEEYSSRIILSTTKYLTLKLDSNMTEWGKAQLIQHVNLIELCTLNIKYISIPYNSTEAIPLYQHQFDIVLNNQIEQFEVQRFIEGPNVTFQNINQLENNNVTFSLSFEQLLQKGIGGITAEGSITYARIINYGSFNFYFLQVEKLDVQMYFCTGSMNSCQFLTQEKFEFNLANMSHEFFEYKFDFFIAVKNNQQLDIWKIESFYNLTYSCTIYPDQESSILQFLYVNTQIAVLYSNQQIVLYSAIGQCQKIAILSNETAEIDDWNPQYISVNEALNILYIKSSQQLILMKINENETYPIDKVQLSRNSSIAIFSYQNTFWVYYRETHLIDSFYFISQTSIYQKCQISLYSIVPNKFIHSQKSKYVYFQYTQDSLGTVQVYNLESSCHSAFQTTFQTKNKILQSVGNLFIMADMSNYFEISNTIKYSIYYQNIRNPNYLVQVNTSLVITNYDRKDKLIYDVHSSLVNPYTTITINEAQLGLIDYLNQKKPIGFCQDKYGWYTGQVIDIGLRSSQLKLRKSIHLIHQDLTQAGIDASEYYDDTILVLHEEKIVKFSLDTNQSKSYFLDGNYKYLSIISVVNPFIFIQCQKASTRYIYSVYCDENFTCYQHFSPIEIEIIVSKIKIYKNLIFVISNSYIQIFQFDDQEIIKTWELKYINQEHFQDIANPQDNLIQIYTTQSNILYMYLYKYEDNELQLQSFIYRDIYQTIQQLGFLVDPNIEFNKITILKENIQQQLYSVEVICQSSQKSHYILQIQQICHYESNNCTINHIKVLQILQGYGGWPSGKLTVYKQSYLLMVYAQAATYLAVLYNLEKNYAHDTTTSSLFTGAIQYYNQSSSHYAFFEKDNQVLFLTNAKEKEVYSLYEIYNTTQFCIQDNLIKETIKLTLKNNFDQIELLIDVAAEEKDDGSGKVIVWIIFGLIGVLLLIFIILGIVYMKIKKKKIENNPFV